METSLVRLNLGCGGKLLPGFVNVDLENNWSSKQPDVVADVTKPLPFPDDYADEVHAYHLFEHIQRWQAESVLADWVRVLKPGGLLVLELPCLDKILRLFAYFVREKKPIDPRLTVWGLYGDPRYENEAMTHKWCYSVGELRQIMENQGLESVEVQQPQTHQPARDMRMVARKWRSIPMRT